MVNKSAINAYTKVGIESSVATASPHQLISLLMRGALDSITLARLEMKNKNISAKGMAISKAINIIESGLSASLNKQAGGAIATNLSDLYQYMCMRLLKANLENNVEILDEVFKLLSGLKETWDVMLKTPSGQVMNKAEEKVTQ